MQKLTKLLRITSIFSVFIQELIEGIKDTPIFEALHDIHLIMKRQERPGTGEVIIIILLHLRPEGTQWLLYNGQGSTRQLVNAANSVDDSYSYDAYGVLLQ